MISYVVSLINLLAVTVHKTLFAASFIGKVIVSAITGISLAIYNIIKSVLIFFQILYEDNISILSEDLPTLTNDIIYTVCDQWSHLQNITLGLVGDVNNRLTGFIISIKWVIYTVASVICEVLILLKNTIVFLGGAVWFIIIFIPVHLPELLKVVFKNVTDYVITVIVDGYMALLNITNFLTDVPLESFLGITIAIVTSRLCIHFQNDIRTFLTTSYWYLIRKMWYYYYVLYNYFIDTEIRDITQMAGEGVDSIELPEISEVVDDDSADALCVICQERQKCVLTLPCRHVCLCTECCMRLYGYQRTCPICRTFIYHSVTVYL